MFARLTSQVFLPLFVEKNPEILNSDNSNSLRTRTEGAFHLSELADRTIAGPVSLKMKSAFSSSFS